MKSYCLNCRVETNQKVLHEVNNQEHDEDLGYWVDNTYQIIECMGCEAISFRELYNDAQQQFYREEDASIQFLYPQRGLHSRKSKAFNELPIEIKRVYNETINAFNEKLYLLSTMGLRALVEIICSDKEIKGGDVWNSTNERFQYSRKLDGKISGLVSKGFISAENAGTLNELRFLGNCAVHEFSAPSIEELIIGFDIIESVIDYIYILKSKALDLKIKRQARIRTLK